MAKNLPEGTVAGLVGTAASNYISQIFDGTNTHDLAVRNGITFFSGSTDTNGVIWDGVQPVEVIIPSIADIVTDPVRLVGTIDENGQGAPASPKNGDLVYIASDCSFAGQACEAGDMAVYTSSDRTWHVISGENQVTINASAATVTGNDNLFTLTGTAKTLLSVEGKTLSVKIDYDDVNAAMKVAKNASATLPVANGTVAVAGKNINLSQAAGTNISVDDISTSVSIDLPTALANGNVTIDKVLEASNFVFNPGSYPVATQNSAAVSATVNHNMSIGKAGEDGATGDYVTSVSAVGGVSFASGNQSDHGLAYVASLSAATGTSFLTGVHARGENEEGTAAFTIPGNVTVTGTSTFISGLSETAATSGDVVTSVTVGEVSGTFVTGLSGKGTTVMTSVTFGDVLEDNTKEWFLKGLTDGSDVVTDVTVGATSLVADNSSAFADNAIVAASVNDHVLSFNTGSFMKPVGLSKASDTITKRGFSTGGVKLSGFDSVSDTLLTGNVSQANSTISYKNVLTGTINVALGNATDYIYDKAEDHAYAAVMGYSKLSITDATVTKNTPKLENTTITATIPANTFVESISSGTLPTFAVNAATGTISGTVGTSLTTSSKSWLGVKSDASFAIPGAYSLVEVSEGGIAVAAASDAYAVNNATVTIAADQYVTDVFVNNSGVAVSNNN